MAVACNAALPGAEAMAETAILRHDLGLGPSEDGTAFRLSEDGANGAITALLAGSDGDSAAADALKGRL